MHKPLRFTFLIAALLGVPGTTLAQSVRDLIPSSAPAGARVVVTGRGLADPSIAVAFDSLSATVIERNDRYIEVVVPSAATSGNVRVTLGTSLVKELPFTLTDAPAYTVTTLAGGPPSKNVVLKHPWAATVILPDGTVAVADEQHNQVKLITPSGVVSVLAGAEKQGFKDGKGAEAEFKALRGITFDARRRVLYVSDSGNSAIREVALDGTVRTLAGNGKQGFKDATGTGAQFKDPYALTVGADGAIYVADSKNHRVRRVTTDGVVTTFAGSGAKGNKDGALLAATFNELRGIVADGADFYVADTKNDLIRKISGGQVTTVAVGKSADGLDEDHRSLKGPSGIGVDEAGDLIVADSDNDVIRRILMNATPPVLTTIAGSGRNGWQDGAPATAQFKDAVGIAVAGAIYVADEDNDAIRRLCAEVRVTGLFSPTGAVSEGTEVRVFGTGFVPGGTIVKFDDVAATDVEWISATELAVNLPQTITRGSVSLVVSACGGTTDPTSFIVDNTPPVLTITSAGVELADGSMFGVPVTPVLTAIDEIDPAPRLTATLNGLAFESGTTVTGEGTYTLVAVADDAAGNRAEKTVHFTIDMTRPQVTLMEGDRALTDGLWFNRDVTPRAVIVDATPTTVAATLNDQPFALGTPIGAEGAYRLAVRVTDAVGNATDVAVTFTIDKTPPAIAFADPAANAVLTTPRVIVAGGSDDAVSVSVNGIAASINATKREFVTPVPIELLEGDNTLTATGVDRAGNTGTVAITVRLDTRAPELTITSPAANACLDATEIQVAGTVSDAALAEVRVATIVATLSADRRSFSATIPAPTEGRIAIRVDAVDASGHTSTATIPVVVDRTRPALQLTESGAPFTSSVVSRPVALYVRATDADASPSVNATLDGQPYANGTAITAEGAHELRAKATDCAGHVSDELVHQFTIDRTAPSLVSIAPSHGSVTGTLSAITGVLSETATVVDEGSGRAATVSGVSFTLDGVLEEGLNSRVLVLTDPAENQSRVDYRVTVDTSAPSVEIVNDGEPIAPSALFREPVTPVIRTNDAEATILATLNGAPFTSGTTISADGTYTVTAKVRDTIGNESATASASFRIDGTAPSVTISSPTAGAIIDADSVEVRGTVTGDDVARVTVNGAQATLTASTFTANVPIDLGLNAITALATDHAGNAGSTSIEIERGRGPIGILLTSPPDDLLTNRPTVVVAGQVLSPSAAEKVTINGVEVPLDPTGRFRKNDFPLTEGENVITATVTGPANSVTVSVTADFTAPVLTVLANGSALSDGTRFATAPSIAVEVTDNATTPLVKMLTIDGELVAEGVVSLINGGHALTATARDAAGNETRVDRVFFIGDTASAAGCALGNFEPADGTAVFSEVVRITGRSGGASGVSINGNAAAVADGSFCGDATLAAGRNEVTIQCTDASGQPTGDAPVKLSLYRYADPAIAITSPASQSLVSADKVTVTGTVGEGVTSGDVNGIAFTVAEGSNTFSVPDVPVNAGLNVLIARAKTSSSRIAATSVHVRVPGAPQIAITSPLAGSSTGAQSIDVGGTYTNIDPSTITVNGSAAMIRALSDTSGTFAVANVALTPAASTTITATGRNAANTQASASVDIVHVTTAPAVAITSPADNTVLASTHSGPLRVTGTFGGEGGTQVQVNGAYATVTDGTFSADVTISSGINPIIARAITPDGRSASDAARAIRLAAPLTVREAFPAADATGVDPGIAIVALFSNPLDRATVANAFRVTDASGAQIDGALFVDRDAITFAPPQPLRNGQRYTVTIAQSLSDASGAAMAAAHTFAFTVAATAPSNAPIVDETATTGCLSGATITGRVSTPGARVRLDVDGVTLTTVSSETGAFKFTFSFSGQSGYHLARVREVGSDGTLSAERAICYRLNCAIPQVLAASLDRPAKKITIEFSKPMDATSLDAAIVLEPSIERTVSSVGAIATVTLTSVPDENIILTVKKTAKDATGTPMTADYTQTFAFDTNPGAGRGDGYITGAIYDATNGRPLEDARITFLNSQSSILNSNNRGRYSRALPEGAYTIEASAPGYTTVWRQVVVSAGAGVVPIDIRLTKRGAENVLTHGGDTKITKRVELASVPSGRTVHLTSVGNQSLAGLLPLGWSPLAAAEIVSDVADLAGARLTFVIDAAAVAAATQTLSLVQYDSERDEWRVVVAVANVPSDGRVTFDVTTAGNYALVYPDDGAPAAQTGAPLVGVANPCLDTPDVCKVVGQSFVLEPKAVLPSGRTVAALTTDGTKPYPSGTAVQAFIDEQLNLADGRVLVDPPFATDLLLYRTLDGTAGVADFHLSPSAQASGVILRDGVDHIRIVDYPGRIDRGTLIGAEGGRVPGDGAVTVDIPAGATSEPLHASVASISDLTPFGSIAGFQIAAGFTFTLTRTSEPQLPEGVTVDGVELLTPARATFNVSSTSQQVIVVEVLDNTPYGVLYRLAALTSPTNFAGVVSTRAIDSTQLPLDGIVRDGRYLVLVADAPIAYAYGRVHSSIAIANARVTANSLGVRDLTRIDGLFVLPVAAKPAAPFTLVPRSVAIGDGAAYVSPSSPDPDAFVNVGVLPLAAQPPRLVSVTPADGAEVDAGAVVVQATFDVSIDAESVADAIRLTNLTTGVVAAGTAVANGPTTVRFNSAEPLPAGSRYSISVLPTIRSTTGTPFGRTAISLFATRALPNNNTIRPDLIYITIPDAIGKSAISGRAGALPTGATAVAVRRGRFFIESYQAVAAGDGSFSFDAGHLHASDKITTSDTIDLQVLDAVSKAIIAIIELTPFVASDGKGFIAPPDRETRFLSIDNIRVIVPAGAFDEPTLIGVEPAAKDAFAGVPNFDAELGYATSIRLSFDGVANKPLDVEMPIPSGFDASGRDWLLGYLGNSVRGPRIAIADIVHVDGSTFKTGPAPNTNGARRVATNAAIFGAELRQYMMRLKRSGIYATVDLQVGGMAAGFIQGLQAGFDLFWDWMASTYAPYEYLVEQNYKIVVPVPIGQQFTIVGVDVATGLDAFTKVYDPIPPGTPVADLSNPDPDRIGPHPVFGTPFRIETLEVNVEGVALTSIRDFTIELRNGRITAETKLPAEVEVTMLNVTRGRIVHRESGLILEESAVGDRIVLIIGQRDVDPYSPLSITFNERLDGDLEELIRVEMRLKPGQGDFVDIGDALRLSSDSNGRRVVIETPASLTRGAEYRVAISNNLAGSGLKIGEIRDENGNVSRGLSEDLYLYFRVREPGDKRASFDLDQGIIRDQALIGNVLLVSAFDGGIVAYDVANPAGMGPDSVPLGRAPATTMSYWGVATDHHGRVYATAVGALFTAIRSFRLEDFLPAAGSGGGTRDVPIRGAGIVSFIPGASANLGIESRTIASDRPEAIPRKLQILVQDTSDDPETREVFKARPGVSVTSTTGEFDVLALDLAREPQSPYATQRITVENVTLDMRWSADATLSSPAQISGIAARAGDMLRVIRNRATYAVVALFGYGIGVYDLNAIENNDAPENNGTIKELVHLTSGALPLDGNCDPLTPDAIPDLTYTPDATVVTRVDSSKLHVMALHAHRGVLDLAIDPATDETTSCDARGRLGLRFPDDPRLVNLRNLFFARTGRMPTPRFTGAARHRWTITSDKNRTGERGSAPGETVTRDYMLIPGFEYGLLVVEVAGDPGPVAAPIYQPLSPFHLVDVIWIPHGAYAVRTIPGRDLATVVDGKGHVLLVDLKRIDERWGIGETDLFPTVASILAKSIDTPDPRIVWTSKDELTRGTLAPVVDPDTGHVYVGKLLDKATHVVAAIDPLLRIRADVGGSGGLSDIGGIVPLGIEPPSKPPLIGENASLAAFRVEVALPGAMNESLSGPLALKLESEVLTGAKALDTPRGWPRAHLDLTMQRVVPDSMPELRYQRGYNKWVSPWIVGVADIRASEKWQWPANTTAEDKAGQGCAKCERPPALKDRPESEVIELYTAGRLVAVRADLSILAGSAYSYLAERLETRIASVPADTLRSREVQIAAHNPPFAGGALQETTYVHSGEIETSSIDLDAGGRAGLNVLIDRTYRSRTIGGTAFGAGWDSLLFRRLRPLPNGNVEYRDGAGEVWLFTSQGEGKYLAPAGLFLKLSATAYGWVLVDQQKREMRFDTLGRFIAETDHLYDKDGGGNITRYLYNDKAQLSRVIDPVGRETFIKYNAQGLVEEITDWRGPKVPLVPGEPAWQGRKITYKYEDGRLTEAMLPEAKAGEDVPPEFDHSGAKRPRIAYSYDTESGFVFNDTVELKTNLKTITDPAEAAATSGKPRVTFNYNSPKRDRVSDQTWATNETATFTYGDVTTVTDALGQVRTFALTGADLFDKRVHISEVTALNVPVLKYVDVTLPVKPDLAPRNESLMTSMKYRDDGQFESITYPNSLKIVPTYENAKGNAPGTIVTKATQTAPGINLEVTYNHEDASNLVDSVVRSEAGVTQTRSTPQPTRGKKKEEVIDDIRMKIIETVVNDEEISTTTKLNENGLPIAMLQTATGNAVVEILAKMRYHAANEPDLIKRAEPKAMIRGAADGEIEESLTYQLVAGGGQRIEAKDEERGTKTVTILDGFDRVVSRKITDSKDRVLADERFGYDASSRLAYHSRTQRELGVVETRTKYDAMGRQRETSMNRAAVDGASSTIKTTTAYDLPNQTIIRTDPTTAEEVTTLDRLGRPIEVMRRGPIAQTIVQKFAYEAGGQRSFESDTLRVAALVHYDPLGRAKKIARSDGTRTEITYTPWGQAHRVQEYQSDGLVFADTLNFYTPEGRLQSTNESIQPANESTESTGSARKTQIGRSKGGTSTIVRVGEVPGMLVDRLPTGTKHRAHQTLVDSAGNEVGQRVGEAGSIFDPNSNEGVWSKTTQLLVGGLPVDVFVEEPIVGARYQTFLQHDGLGRLVEQTTAGEFTTKIDYDEAGNALSMTRLGMTETAEYDSRGLVTTRTLPDGKTNEFRYDALGNLRQMIDEAVVDETKDSTFYDYDAFGRLFGIRYADGTSEETVYEDKTSVIKATRNRANQWLSYSYDDGGRVVGVHDGEAATAETLLVKYEYNAAGRLSAVRNKDAAIEYAEYDQLGRPGVTRTYRYLAGTGVETNRAELDVHVQRHTWSIYDGERTSWRMPAAGETPPIADNPLSKWLQTIVEMRDAGSNLVAQTTSDDVSLTTANPRSVGRVRDRRRVTPTATITTAYGFADGLSAPSELPTPVADLTASATGLPLWSQTYTSDTTLAGASNVRDSALRLDSLRDLATERRSLWNYDARGRLTETWLGITPPKNGELPVPSVTDTLIDADFREHRETSSLFTAFQREKLGTIEPQTWTAGRGKAHQIDAFTLNAIQNSTRDYVFEAGRRTSDGLWAFEFDKFGRMTSATSSDRRIVLTWDPNDRVVGRVAYQKDGDGWKLEERDAVLTRDGLPATTTFVWDPIVDRLVAIYRQGSSTQSEAPADAGLIRQYLHGDQSYDDPTRVLIAGADGQPKTYLPIADDAGAGSLSAVVDTNGNLVERILYADSYGDAPRYLQGAVADKIELEVTKDNDGNVESVKVRVHLSERIEASTLATGARLASVKDDKTLAQLSNVVPEIEGDFTIQWTLSAAEWNLLANATDAKSLEVSLTSALRLKGWGETPVMPVPGWARKIYSGVDTASAQPVIYRESLSSIRSRAGARGVYEIPSLYLAASDESKAKLLFDFKAWPFREPATELIYARARFYDSATGEFLTPDPMGYADSSNLYAGLARDPVNNSDPHGTYVESAWDAASLGLGIYQITQWDENTSGWAKALDVIGVGVDTVAFVLPLVPAGVGAGLKAYRAGDALHDTYKLGRTLDRGLNAVQGIDQGFNTIQAGIYLNEDLRSGNIGWGTGLNALQFGIGLRSLRTRGIGDYRLGLPEMHAGVRYSVGLPIVSKSTDALLASAKTGRAYDRRFRNFWRRFEGDTIGDWRVASVNRRFKVADGSIQPDLVLINDVQKQIRIHDVTSRYSRAHWQKGDRYVEYFQSKYSDYAIQYSESYWEGLEEIVEAVNRKGQRYYPGNR